jgi:hypothetical protein
VRAAAAMPNDHRSMVLEGSSTGKPFAADGTPEPEAVGVFRQPGRDRTGQGLWRHRARHSAGALCDRDDHPAGHISHEAIGYSFDWFAKTVQGGTPRPADDQIWFRKEFGTGLALLRLRRTPDRGLRRPFGSVDVLESALRLPVVEDGTMPAHSAASGHRWTVALILSALIPALTY